MYAFPLSQPSYCKVNHCKTNSLGRSNPQEKEIQNNRSTRNSCFYSDARISDAASKSNNDPDGRRWLLYTDRSEVVIGEKYLLDGVWCLTVSLSDQLGWLSCVSRFQLSGWHDNWCNAQLLERQIALECLSLSLSSPDSYKDTRLNLLFCLLPRTNSRYDDNKVVR